MSQLKFDENLAIREVLDDIIGMVARREKLISAANEQAEKTRDERTAQHVKKLEVLMSDFLTLFEPVLDRVRAYGESLRESISESEAYIKSLEGIIEAGKAIDGTSATLTELEKDADSVQGQLQQSTEILAKIQDLSESTRPYRAKSPEPRSSEDVTSQLSSSRTRHAPHYETEPVEGSRSRVFTGSRLSSHESSKGQR